CLEGGHVVVVHEPLQRRNRPLLERAAPIGQAHELEHEVRAAAADVIADGVFVHVIAFRSPNASCGTRQAGSIPKSSRTTLKYHASGLARAGLALAANAAKHTPRLLRL